MSIFAQFHMLMLQLNKITYFIVAQELGEETADDIFKNQRCKSKYPKEIKDINKQIPVIKVRFGKNPLIPRSFMLFS